MLLILFVLKVLHQPAHTGFISNINSFRGERSRLTNTFHKHLVKRETIWAECQNPGFQVLEIFNPQTCRGINAYCFFSVDTLITGVHGKARLRQHEASSFNA
jgi:hypothetical protein